MSASDCLFFPNIYHTFADSEYLYLVLEYIACSTLLDALKPVSRVGFSRPIAQFYTAQIVVALEYLQS
jgi:serine/threonine protein kinase